MISRFGEVTSLHLRWESIYLYDIRGIQRNVRELLTSSRAAVTASSACQQRPILFARLDGEANTRGFINPRGFPTLFRIPSSKECVRFLNYIR